MTHVDLDGRALCTLDDVVSYAPGYADQSHAGTDDTLVRLINAESQTAHNRAGREFKPIAAGSVERLFDITPWNQRTRRVRIGDAATITAVVIKDQAAATLETVAAGDWIALPRARQAWEPIRQLWFPPASAVPAVELACGNVLHVTGTWGYPAVPDDVREAVAKLVIVRYLNDAAAAGTAFADAIANTEIDAAALLRSAFQTLQDHADPPFA